MNRFGFVGVREVEKHRGALSESTIARQKQEVRQISQQLHAGGFKLTELRQLRGKSIAFLLDVWAGRRSDPANDMKVRALSPGVQAVRLSTLRKLCKWGGKPGLLPKKNIKAGIEPRERVPVANVAWNLTQTDLAKVSSHHVRLVLRLQREFGLRRKEGFLLDARTAVRGEVLSLTKGTKGGKPRQVPIRTEDQRTLLAQVQAANGLTPKGTLVSGPSLKGSFDEYKNEMRRAGLFHGHGLRHAYAQERYHHLVKRLDPAGKGWLCPKAGGPGFSQLSPNDRKIDADARKALIYELGHGRVEVAAIYLGKEGADDAEAKRED